MTTLVSGPARSKKGTMDRPTASTADEVHGHGLLKTDAIRLFAQMATEKAALRFSAIDRRVP
jgi:hypothetical protein